LLPIGLRARRPRHALVCYSVSSSPTAQHCSSGLPGLFCAPTLTDLLGYPSRSGSLAPRHGGTTLHASERSETSACAQHSRIIEATNHPNQGASIAGDGLRSWAGHRQNSEQRTSGQPIVSQAILRRSAWLATVISGRRSDARSPRPTSCLFGAHQLASASGRERG
jgi:hypothetical protein